MLFLMKEIIFFTLPEFSRALVCPKSAVSDVFVGTTKMNNSVILHSMMNKTRASRIDETFIKLFAFSRRFFNLTTCHGTEEL